jgi:hypothetical protein
MFFTCRICEGQNLVPNGDFEQYSVCPTWYAQLDSTLLYWMNPCIAPFIPGGTPDYYNSCAPSGDVGVPVNANINYQPARSGNGYAGIITWNANMTSREYIEVPLSSQLISNECYHFEMYVNLRNTCQYGTDAIGVYFSDTAVAIPNVVLLPFPPQINNIGYIIDTLNWVLVSGNYTATGGENYLIIGNFNDDANTNAFGISSSGSPGAYYFIEDVSLTPCTGIEQQNVNDEIKIYPNLFTDILNIKANNNSLSEIILYDITSRKLLHQQFTNTLTLNTSHLSKGIYIYELRPVLISSGNKNGVIKKGKVVKD